jgi:hypothetical protein
MIIMVDVTPLAVGGTSSWTYDGTAVNGTSNVKITNGPALVDVTELGDNFVNRFPTIRDWSMNFDMVYGGGHTLTGSVYIESVNYSFDPKEVVRASVSMKGDSLLVYA